MNAPNWTPAFAGETNIRKAWFFVVIPAEAGIQALKAKVPFLDSRFRRDFLGGHNFPFKGGTIHYPRKMIRLSQHAPPVLVK